MLHRHPNDQRYPLAATDDVIARGPRHDWVELRRPALSDPLLMTKVLQVCAAHVSDPHAQRYHFWRHYGERHLA